MCYATKKIALKWIMHIQLDIEIIATKFFKTFMYYITSTTIYTT